MLAPTVRDGTGVQGEKAASGPSGGQEDLREAAPGGRGWGEGGGIQEEVVLFQLDSRGEQRPHQWEPTDTDSTYVRIPPGPHLPRNP